MVRSELSNQTQQSLLHLQPEAASHHYKNILQMIAGVFMDAFLWAEGLTISSNEPKH